VDRLRTHEDETVTVLSATDPANVYGAIVPWPDGPGKPTRRAGARIALSNGRLIAWMDPAGKRTLLFTDDPDEASTALRLLAQTHGKASIVEIDGESAHEHDVAQSLRQAGFIPGYKGFTVGDPHRTSGKDNGRQHRRTPR
jgi:ATP-dependent Lhr-like helicase